MRSPWRGRRALLPALLLALAGVSPVAAAGPQVTGHPVGLDGLTVAAPPPGYGVAASAITSTGGHIELVLETGLDGVTRRVVEPQTVALPVTPSASVARVRSACQDGTYHLLPMKWKSAWRWWFQSRSTPAELRVSKAERHLQASVLSITNERNDCGRPDRVDARSSYMGRTRTRPGVDANGCTNRRDGRSVVGFGTLPYGYLGLTCTTYALVSSGVDTAVESDVLFNKKRFRWATSLSHCDGAIILRSVATHEFGHVFGLNHVSEAAHPDETMSEAIGPCDDSAFTLALGDMRGLEKRYQLPGS